MDTKPTAQKWYSITPLAASADSGAPEVEVFVLGNIGDRWDENGVIAADMVKDLSKLSASNITLRINSYGGSVTDGLAIYNALKRHTAPVHAVIEGVALSCASYIAMAADTIEMADNAQMMIHAPWGMFAGNEIELRERADMLRRYAQSMSGAYASKSGKPTEEIMAILTDGKDHWYSAAEAVAAGFADTVGPANAVSAHLAKSFDTSRFSQTVATATPKKEPTMADPVQAVVPVTPMPFARTKADNAQVVAMFAPFADTPAVAALQTEVLTDPGLTVDTIRARLLDTVGAQSKPAAHTPRITTVADEGDKIRAAATTAILHRAGVVAAKREELQGNPFAGSKMLDIAKASLARAGVSTDGMMQSAIVNASFTQSGSDFPIILENTMHKALQSGYATAALTWNQFCATGSVSDFREHKRYRLGSFGNLDTVNELGEFTNKSIPDGERSGITASTKGNIINL
jgi:ATP-dependent protease ClpP protease subunit